VCGIVFGTYRGALAIDLRTLFWNLLSISMLKLPPVPQRGLPYVQMGFSIVLYISNLFSSDSFDFLPMIQYMRWSCNPSCFLLVNMCFCHVSLHVLHFILIFLLNISRKVSEMVSFCQQTRVTSNKHVVRCDTSKLYKLKRSDRKWQATVIMTLCSASLCFVENTSRNILTF